MVVKDRFPHLTPSVPQTPTAGDHPVLSKAALMTARQYIVWADLANYVYSVLRRKEQEGGINTAYAIIDEIPGLLALEPHWFYETSSTTSEILASVNQAKDTFYVQVSQGGKDRKSPQVTTVSLKPGTGGIVPFPHLVLDEIGDTSFLKSQYRAEGQVWDVCFRLEKTREHTPVEALHVEPIPDDEYHDCVTADHTDGRAPSPPPGSANAQVTLTVPSADITVDTNPSPDPSPTAQGSAHDTEVNVATPANSDSNFPTNRWNQNNWEDTPRSPDPVQTGRDAVLEMARSHFKQGKTVKEIPAGDGLEGYVFWTPDSQEEMHIEKPDTMEYLTDNSKDQVFEYTRDSQFIHKRNDYLVYLCLAYSINIRRRSNPGPYYPILSQFLPFRDRWFELSFSKIDVRGNVLWNFIGIMNEGNTRESTVPEEKSYVLDLIKYIHVAQTGSIRTPPKVKAWIYQNCRKVHTVKGIPPKARIRAQVDPIIQAEYPMIKWIVTNIALQDEGNRAVFHPMISDQEKRFPSPHREAEEVRTITEETLMNSTHDLFDLGKYLVYWTQHNVTSVALEDNQIAEMKEVLEARQKGPEANAKGNKACGKGRGGGKKK